MVTIERIINGYVATFKNTENKKIKLFFPSLDALTVWLSDQFEIKKETK